MGNFLIRLLATAVALWVATVLVGGIKVGGSETERILTLVGVALILGLVNAVVKPVANLLSLPAIVLTLGLFLLVVNALMLWLTAWVAGGLGLAFEVDGFWAAFWGALIVSVVVWLVSLAARDD